LLGQGGHDGVVIEALLGNRAFTYVGSAGLVEGLSMREDPNLLVAQLVLAYFANHVFSDDQVGLLEGVELNFTVNLFDCSQLNLDLLVLFGGHLVVEDRLQEGYHIVLRASEVPVFRNHVQHFKSV